MKIIPDKIDRDKADGKTKTARLEPNAPTVEIAIFLGSSSTRVRWLVMLTDGNVVRITFYTNIAEALRYATKLRIELGLAKMPINSWRDANGVSRRALFLARQRRVAKRRAGGR